MGLKVSKTSDISGFTLIELLISIAILGIVMIGLHQIMGTTFSAYDRTKNTQDLLAQARFAIERMANFVQETDYISKPDDVDQEILKVAERLLDTYNNSDHSYNIDGDGNMDADGDSDGTINEDGVDTGGSDPYDYISFYLNKDDANNWKLGEEMPDYGSSGTTTFNVICEHVMAFKCSRLALNLVEIQLNLYNNDSGVTLTTRARARFVE